MTKKLLVSLLVLGSLVSAGCFEIGTASTRNERPKEVLLTEIAQKFNLKKEDVEAVFQAVEDERQLE